MKFEQSFNYEPSHLTVFITNKNEWHKWHECSLGNGKNTALFVKFGKFVPIRDNF